MSFLKIFFALCGPIALNDLSGAYTYYYIIYRIKGLGKLMFFLTE